MGVMRINTGTFLFTHTGDMSQTSIQSTPSPASIGAGNGEGEIAHLRFVAPYVKWTGTSPVGTLQLQVSPDNLTFYNIGSAVPVTGNTGNYLWDLIETGCHWMRVLYTKTSGTGTLTGGWSGKGM